MRRKEDGLGSSACLLCCSSDRVGGELMAEGLSLRARLREERQGDPVLPVIGHLPSEPAARHISKRSIR